MLEQHHSSSDLKLDNLFGFINKNTDAPQISNPSLISNGETGTMLQAIRHELERSKKFVFSIAFITSDALASLKQDLIDFDGDGIIITSTYLGFNKPEVFYELLNLPNTKVMIFNPKLSFHAKGYIFDQQDQTTAIIGSSNLTSRALLTNNEWNLKFSAAPEGDIVRQLEQSVNEQIEKSVFLSREWIVRYEATYLSRTKTNQNIPLPEELQETYDLPAVIKPNSMQQEALIEIQKVRDQDQKRALVISATGTGKTILAALDVKQFQPKKLLFIVHREQILDRAIEEFKRVLNNDQITYGKLAGGSVDKEAQYVFATIQSLSRESTLNSYSGFEFDYIIIDEVHRAGAATYRKVINYFNPEFLLGFTATPERTDNFNLFELFNYNVPYEIRLQQALENSMLVPFHYYGVTDFQYDDGTTVDETSELSKLVIPERIDHLLEQLKIYGRASNPVKGLIFCSSVEEAYGLENALNKRIFNGKLLRTVALSGSDSIEHREKTVDQLEAGNLDYIITVDIFNEGVDIPSVNQIVMMRQTQSSIIFTQQLGRGLRKSPNKDHLIVIDFIGNYKNNYMIPIALTGGAGQSRDRLRKNIFDVDLIEGLSSINFDKISKQRIFDSINKAKLDGVAELKKTFINIKQRLGSTPKLLDFARFDALDPVVLANKRDSYWGFLNTIKEINSKPSEAQKSVLTFLSRELLNGKRPHELLLLQELLTEDEITVEHLKELLSSKDCTHDDQTIRSVINILTLDFYTKDQQKIYGNLPLITLDSSVINLTSPFKELLKASHFFFAQVLDLIETGLYTSRHRYGWSSTLIPGEMYSRKDVCRLLNWKSNQESMIYGYKVDYFSNSCPIFVTYHKDEEILASINYQDELLNPNVLSWFSRSRRTLNSKEIKPIVNNEVPQFLFAKKDNAEGKDFYFLGKTHASDAKNAKMPGKNNEPLNVVNMYLTLDNPLDQPLFDYLTAPTLNP